MTINSITLVNRTSIYFYSQNGDIILSWRYTIFVTLTYYDTRSYFIAIRCSLHEAEITVQALLYREVIGRRLLATLNSGDKKSWMNEFDWSRDDQVTTWTHPLTQHSTTDRPLRAAGTDWYWRWQIPPGGTLGPASRLPNLSLDKICHWIWWPMRAQKGFL